MVCCTAGITHPHRPRLGGGGDSLARRISLLESWSRLFQWSQTELTLHLSARSVVCACVNHLGLSKADFDFYVFQIRIRSQAFPPAWASTGSASMAQSCQPKQYHHQK